MQAFPSEYDTAIRQMQLATKAALADGHKLLEVEFPTAGLAAAQGNTLWSPTFVQIHFFAMDSMSIRAAACTMNGVRCAAKLCYLDRVTLFFHSWYPPSTEQ